MPDLEVGRGLSDALGIGGWVYGAGPLGPAGLYTDHRPPAECGGGVKGDTVEPDLKPCCLRWPEVLNPPAYISSTVILSVSPTLGEAFGL